ncbi:MAG TPA: hypothetical protein VHG51_13520 [Longimicrobiaceae bacterium]|nr:hypothetical protein [Longimicrobiaceae bacterium]
MILPGIATLRIPRDALPATQQVSVCATSTEETRRDFRITAEDGLGARRVLPYEIRINTGTAAPGRASVEIALPPSSTRAPAAGRVRPFVQFWQEGGEETLDGFEAVPHTYDPASTTLRFELPEGSFTDLRRTDQTYEAVIVIGSMPAA